MVNKLDIAISFGSTNTTIFLKKSGIVLSEPTLVLRDGTKVFFGDQAKNFLGRAVDQSQFICPVKCGAVVDEFNATELLKYFLDKIVPKRLFFKCQINATFLVPCGLTQKQKLAFKNVAYGAGVSNVKFAFDVICAKNAYLEVANQKDSAIVCDIGGGKTDIAVVSGQKIVAGKTLLFGSGDIDVALKEYIEKTYDLVISQFACEKIKTNIASLYLNDKANIEIGGISASTREPKTEILCAEDIYCVVNAFYEDVAKEISELVKEVSSDIASDIISNGCYFCGGGSLIAGLEKMMSLKLSLKVTTSDDADLLVVLGAGKTL